MKLTVLILGFGEERLPWIIEACRRAGLMIAHQAEAANGPPPEQLSDVGWSEQLDCYLESVDDDIAFVDISWLESSASIDLYVDDLAGPGIVQVDSAAKQARLDEVRDACRSRVAERVEKSRWLELPATMGDAEKAAEVDRRVADLRSGMQGSAMH